MVIVGGGVVIVYNIVIELKSFFSTWYGITLNHLNAIVFSITHIHHTTVIHC